MRAKEFTLTEFASGNSGGESGRWYTDNQMTDIVGDGWWQDLDVSGANIGVIDSEVPKEYMIQQAQAWLDDQGYNVRVLNCRVNDDDMDWFIEGSFQNSSFAKKGMAEGKGLAKKVKIVKGSDSGKTGWIREIKHGAYKGAPKTYYIDLDDGGQANNLPATALRLVKEQGVAEGDSNPNQQIALYNPNGKTYRAINKMPTLDPKDPGHQSNGYRIDPNKSYETDFDKEDLKRVISRGMSSLTDSDKHILELRFWDDLTYNEIAAKLGIPSEQVKSLEALALRKLKRPKISDTLRPYSWLQGMAEATGDERFDSMMGRLASGAAARQDVDRLSTSLTARTGSNPESALAKWGQEFIKWLEDICRNIARQGVDKFSKFEKLGNFDDGGETMAHWLIEVAKKSNTSGITLADIQEFSGEFNSHGMWAWQQFPLAWSQSEWQDYKDQWTGPDGYIANLGQGVKEEQTNHWYDAGVKDATRGARPNPRTYLPTLKDKQAKHPEEVYFYMNGYKSVKQGMAEGLNEFAMDDGNNGEDPTDNYPCYDCGSTIFLHHTKLCDLAEPNAKHDLPARPGSQHWTGEIPKGLHPIPGLQEDVAENFIDGQHPEDKGDSKRHGINTKASVSSLRKTAKHSSGRKQKLAHWLANMKAGQAKANKK